MKKLFPSLTEEMQTLGVRLPLSILEEIERRAGARITSKSDIGRQLIIAALRQDGIIATEAEIKKAL